MSKIYTKTVKTCEECPNLHEDIVRGESVGFSCWFPTMSARELAKIDNMPGWCRLNDKLEAVVSMVRELANQ